MNTFILNYVIGPQYNIDKKIFNVNSCFGYIKL